MPVIESSFISENVKLYFVEHFPLQRLINVILAMLNMKCNTFLYINMGISVPNLC